MLNCESLSRGALPGKPQLLALGWAWEQLMAVGVGTPSGAPVWKHPNPAQAQTPSLNKEASALSLSLHRGAGWTGNKIHFISCWEN